MKTKRGLLGALVGILAVLLILTPSEQKLGTAIKAVFLHGAVTWVSFVVFIIFSISALIYLITGKQQFFALATRAQTVGTGFWLVNFFIWVPLGYLEWNVVAWSGEPKAVAAVWVMLFLAGGYLAGQIISKPKILAGLYVVIGAGIWWRYSGVGRVLHPLDPIGSSNSLLIKVFFIAILVITLLIAMVLLKTSSRETRTF